MTFSQNPFQVLGVSSQHSRREILSAAQERSLVVDEHSVREARSVLVHPIKRISAEVAWVPGVAPEDVNEVLSMVKYRPERVLEYKYRKLLPALAHANVLAETLIHLGEDVSSDELAQWIVAIAESYDAIDIEHTIESIDADRSIAGFPLVSRSDVVESSLDDRRRYFRGAIQGILERYPLLARAHTLTIAVEETTADGGQAPLLIDDLVDRFEDHNRSVLEEGTVQIGSLCADVLKAVSEHREPDRVVALVGRLVDAVKSWDELAQPGQVSARSRGLRHPLSLEVASMIRRLAIRLHNDHALSMISIVLINLQLEVFAEVDSVVEESEEDAKTLTEMLQKHRDGEGASADELVAGLTRAIHATSSTGPTSEIKQDHALSTRSRGSQGEQQDSGAPSCGCLLIFIALVVAVVLGLCSSGGDRLARDAEGKSSESGSHRPQRTESQSTQESPQSSARREAVGDGVDLVYRRPLSGNDNLLSIPHIRWCLRQSIRLEAARDVVSSIVDVEHFNELVADYNSRCGSYRYRSGSLSQARGDVESARDQIEADAITDFGRW